MNKEITALTVAKFFLTKEAMTQKKIQKLVYYAYAWYITNFNNNENKIKKVLFEEEPEAWVHGPVFRSLYDQFKSYGWSNISKIDCVNLKDKKIEKFLDSIWDVYGIYDGDELEVITHKEMPWIKAREGMSATEPSTQKITQKDIYIYYNSI